ncbi:MAG: hypothetical protein QOI12_3691 [Alphaproteobacteria bacterium]|nr:hypothetical protein [Alphaproteobacteria bacterium]
MTSDPGMSPANPLPDPEQRARNIAEELSYDSLVRPNAATSYYFRLDDRKVKLTLTFDPPDIEGLDKLYVAVKPPGPVCTCCNGSGKRTPPPPHASAETE